MSTSEGTSTGTSGGLEPGRIREPRTGRVQSKLFDTVGMRCSPEWSRWLYRSADAAGETRQGVLAVGAAKLAAEVGFEPPPPRL
jgi:hypothetical protein